MLKRALICMVLLAFVMGCANQQKETTEKDEAQTEVIKPANDNENTENTEQAETAAVEEISITVTGMT